MKQKRPRKRRTFVFLLLLIIGIVAVPIGVRKYKDYVFRKEHPQLFWSGLETMSDEEYMEYLKSQPSDIDGWTKYDKYIYPLDIADGSDTDEDGLTDKEEIEVYGSDPSKASTSGDLYMDGYKAEHGMDLHTYYEYQGDIEIEDNACPEVLLYPTVPTDFYTVVEDHTGWDEVIGHVVYKEYFMYNYSSQISIDVSGILEENQITMDDIDIVIECQNRAKDVAWTKENDDTVKVKYDFKWYYDYRIFVVDRSTKGNIMCRMSGADAVYEAKPDEGICLVVESPVLTYFTHGFYKIWYEKKDSEESSDDLRAKVVKRQNELHFAEQIIKAEESNAVAVSRQDIEFAEFLLHRYLPMFLDNSHQPEWWIFLVCYREYAFKLENSGVNFSS